jgi:hypothetical protein
MPPLRLPADARNAALDSGGPECRLLSSLDSDLQRVTAAWDGLLPAIRKATLAMIGSSDEAGV